MKQNKTIGSILLDVELVTQKDIEQALELQKQTGKRVGEVLVQLEVVSDDDIRWALAEQLNLPYVNIRKDQIDSDVARLIPEKLARRYHVIPILKIDRELTVVVDDPLNTTIIKDIETITKCAVKISLGRTSDILVAIDEIYGSQEEPSQYTHEIPPRFMSPWLEDEALQKILNDPSGQVLLQEIVEDAVNHGVSRLYFQPGADICHVSFRVKGKLQEQMQLSREWYSILLFRLKINAHAGVSPLQYPEYHEFTYYDFQAPEDAAPAKPPVTFAVSFVPTATGEAAVMNIIHKPVAALWENLCEDAPPALQTPELDAVRALHADLRHRQGGALLLGGGSYVERLTTLYALINDFDPVQQKIVTLDMTPEFRADQFYQIRYGGEQYADAGFEPQGFAFPMRDDVRGQTNAASNGEKPAPTGRGLLRPQQRLSAWLGVLPDQDPDILLIDQLGNETVLTQSLDFAGRALIFAALDLPNIFHLLAYLTECQIKPSTITSKVQILMAQHTVRLLCPACKQPDATEESQRLRERFQPKADLLTPVSYAPVGCPLCDQTGYRQQVVLFEILRMEAWLKDMLLNGQALREIERQAHERGFRSLASKCVDLLLTGQTALNEVGALIA